jgi:hypothetical protein
MPSKVPNLIENATAPLVGILSESDNESAKKNRRPQSLLVVCVPSTTLRHSISVQDAMLNTAV